MVLAENRERILSGENLSTNFLMENSELWKKQGGVLGLQVVEIFI